MGSLERQYTLCEKCRGLFIDPDVATGHITDCQGNIKVSNCDFVACEKQMFLQYVQPKITPTRKTPGRPRKKKKIESPSEALVTTKGGSPNRSPTETADAEKKQTALEDHGSPRRYELRRGAAAALRHKITDIQRILGIHRKEKKEERKPSRIESTVESVNNNEPAAELNQGKLVRHVEIGKKDPSDPPVPDHEDCGGGDGEENTNVEGSEKISTTEMAASILQKLKSSSNVVVGERSNEANQTKESEEISNDKSKEDSSDKVNHEEPETGASLILEKVSQRIEEEPPGDEKESENVTIDHDADIGTDKREESRRNGEGSDDINASKNQKRGHAQDSSSGQIAKKLKQGSSPDEESLKALTSLPAPDSDGVYHCTLCWYTSPKEGMFRRHLGSHNDGNMYTCEFCNAQFLYRRLYRQHMGTHNGFQCEHCGKMFGRRHDRQRHIQTIHTGETKYECDICGYTCRHHHLFHDHKRKHTDDRFLCKVEGCTFKTIYRRALSHHVNTVHNDEKNLVCDSCGYRTNDPCSFSKHKKTHDNLRKYKCSECDYTASTMGYVRSHMMSHSTEKLYKCDQCEYTCVRRSGIRSHMMKHIGVKPWSCPNCEYSSTTKNKVKRHISMRHRDNSEPRRQKIKVQFDTDAYRIVGAKQGTEGNDNEGLEETVCVSAHDDVAHPKYVVIEMYGDEDDDDETGTALGSNLVAEEVEVQDMTESTQNPFYEPVTDTSQESSDHLTEQGQDTNCLYKCALCEEVDADLSVIQEHMSVVHSETETVTAPEETVQIGGQAEITIAQLLEAAASSTPDEHHDQESISDAINSGNLVHSGVACIYQAADGTVINPIEVEHISDHQIVALQDDAVSTAVESILHLQNIPIRGDVV